MTSLGIGFRRILRYFFIPSYLKEWRNMNVNENKPKFIEVYNLKNKTEAKEINIKHILIQKTTEIIKIKQNGHINVT